MKDVDIDFSDKASWEYSCGELFVVLCKRILSFPAKVIGFKPMCLFVATWLLINGQIRDWIWFCVVVIVLFGIVGLKILSRWKNEEEIDK